MTGEAWKKYREAYDDMNALDKPIEVEVCHKGNHDWLFGRMKRIGRFMQDGAVAECWEMLPIRGAPVKFTVFLPGEETLPTYLEDVRFMDTDYGSTLVNRLAFGAALALDLFLIALMFSGSAVNIDPASPLFLMPVTACVCVVVTALMFGRSRFCKRISLECAHPDGEQGDHHVVYITHSSIANVAEQLGFISKNKDLYDKAVIGLRNLISKQVDLKDIRIAHLENQLGEIDQEMAGAQSRTLNRMIGWQFKAQTPDGSWKRTAGIIVVAAAVIAAVAGLIIYLKG